MQTVLIRTVCDKLSRMFHDYINHLGSLHGAPTSTLSHINYLQLDSRSSKGVFILPHNLFLSLSLSIYINSLFPCFYVTFNERELFLSEMYQTLLK